MGSVDRPIFNRKTMPASDRGTRLSVGNNGSRPIIESQKFALDSIKDGQRVPGPQVELPLPLTQFQIIHQGGGRPIGGGTSREALRRAKKKPC